MLPPAIETFWNGEVVPMPTVPAKEAIPETERALDVALSKVAPPTTSSFEVVVVEVKPISTWFVEVPGRIPEPLKKVQFESLATVFWSVPQLNWRVVALHRSLSAEEEQEERLAPATVPSM